MSACISKSNTKLGRVQNFSLAPLKTCSKEACATCGKDCYATKFYRMYPNVRQAWNNNTDLAMNDLKALEKDLCDNLSCTKPQLFRIHVGGDFISPQYARMWARVGRSFPDTKFLAFTKSWEILQGVDFPHNMTIIHSAWPQRLAPPANRPIAWMDDGTENRIPASAHLCQGGAHGITCNTCQKCWNLTDTDVVFAKH